MSSPEHHNDLFHIDPEAAEVGSLSNYIMKHLQQRQEPEAPGPFVAENKPFWQNQIYQTRTDAAGEGTGMILHHLDSQLANSGLEKYLPTPATRYQMMRDRIGRELDELYAALKHYREFPGEEYHAKIEALEQRSSLLQRKVFELDQRISKLNPFQSMYSKLQHWAASPGEASTWTLIPNAKDKLRQEVGAVQQELESLKHILETHLHDPSFSPQQLSRVVNQYDSYLKKAERLSDELRNQKSLHRQFGEHVSSLYQSWQRKK